MGTIEQLPASSDQLPAASFQPILNLCWKLEAGSWKLRL
jgi:hypothetical protein